MATTVDFINFVCDQIESPFAVRYKKMFGEYMVYVDEKPILLVCDNMVFVKIKEKVAPLFEGANTGVPYVGAKPHFILDIEDRALVKEVVDILVKITPAKVKKIKK